MCVCVFVRVLHAYDFYFPNSLLIRQAAFPFVPFYFGIFIASHIAAFRLTARPSHLFNLHRALLCFL